MCSVLLFPTWVINSHWTPVNLITEDDFEVSLYLLQNRSYITRFCKPRDFRRLRKWVANILSNRYKPKHLSRTCTKSPEICFCYCYRRKSNKENTSAVLKRPVTEQTQGCWHTCFLASTHRVPRILLLYSIDFCAISLIDTDISWYSVIACL